MQRKRKWEGKKWIAVALLALAALTAGCSGSGGSSADRASSGTAEMASSESANVAMETPAEAPMADMMYSKAEEGAAAGEGASSGDAVLAGGAAPSGTAVAPVAAQGRMLIYKANVTMEVESYADTYTAVQNLIHLSGGYLLQFSEQAGGSEKSGLFTIKVPAADFGGFMDRLEEIPNAGLNRSMNAQDVSEEFVDLEARLKAKELVESRYLKYMEQASRSEDLIRYTNELAAIQEEIERLKGRMRYLQQNVDFSTIELRVYERSGLGLASQGGDATLAEKMSAALKSSLNALVVVAEGVMIVVAGALPVIVVAILVGTPIYWFVRRRKAKNEKNRPLIP
ncbi:DUF4349 domain-containing protein [Paenibacillus antri]|uniref:DUF4349 domain-containing protein n=1 Tax=Paenibacillus antri TaxID=2582848 RepID=A0A5R9G219_9BACL|nr:DUF4349 domain-containing protein [Paenibacillus antri]TLS50392.1 DUF4349 domain-containing protein [Paenibacillus antri]